jgi:hypothetical protein
VRLDESRVPAVFLTSLLPVNFDRMGAAAVDPTALEMPGMRPSLEAWYGGGGGKGREDG